MSTDSQHLLEKLPAILRIRDAELATREGLAQGPLSDLLSVIAEQVAVVEENVEQSYDDLFVETCADWLTSYVGDLIGYQSLHGNVPDVASPRAEVAHTIALRRRKGTAVVLEQLARDVTGWPARAVEFFAELGWTQYMNHDRPDVHYCPSLRDIELLARVDSAFDRTQHTVDVRRVESSRGRYNIPNIGLFLWRLGAYLRSDSPAQRLDSRRYLVSPLGHAEPMYSRPRSLGVNPGILAQPVHVPEPLVRRQLHERIENYYGLRATTGGDIDNPEPSILLFVDGTEIPRDQVSACNLSDEGPDWAHEPPAGVYYIDPELGRIALPPDAADPAEVLVTSHRGFSADMGGGEYERLNSFSLPESASIQLVPDDHATIQDALDALGGSGVVEIRDNARYEEALTVSVSENSAVELRAANGRNPHLFLTAAFSISGDEGSRFSINGCLLSGNGLNVTDDGVNALQTLEIGHCTLVPGESLDGEGLPVTPGAPSIVMELPGAELSIDRSITGALRMDPSSECRLVDSIIDANALENPAFAGIDGDSAGAVLSASACTVIGKIHARAIGTISNSILLARLATGDSWNAAVWAERKQTGCVRFSFLPWDSIAPRRFRCQPHSDETARSLAPRFTSLSYGHPAYGQLTTSTAKLIRTGADDESEMGAFHHLYAPQRELNLQIRLREYLRVGLRAGIFYES
jgi:hypothetical protein